MSDPIRIIKKASCPSLSGQSSLSYQIGCSPGADIFIRIDTNSGNGHFNKEWIPLTAILDILLDGPPPIAGYTLSPLYQGQSVNSAFFLLATLKNEGLVIPLKRSYEVSDPDSFMAKMKGLMDTPAGDSKKRPKKKVTKTSSIQAPSTKAQPIQAPEVSQEVLVTQ